MWRHLGDSHGSLSHHVQLHFFHVILLVQDLRDPPSLFSLPQHLFSGKKNKLQGLTFVIPVSSHNFEAFLLPSSLQFSLPAALYHALIPFAMRQINAINKFLKGWFLLPS